MFLNFYGLKEQPFGVTPDPRYLYLSNTHREALASLFYGIQTGRGFMAMVAKPGMGKTTLLVQLLKKFQGSARTAFLFNTQCNSREFLEALASELGFECSSANFVQFLEQFNRNLVREAREHRRCIVVIDEAQNLDASVLETARLLSNFETPSAKLLQIVFAGQPELADKLASPALSQLRQRISNFSRLDTFNDEESVRYVYHRLKFAGYAGPALFTDEAMSMIAAHGQGVPRNLNTLCFGALSIGCALKAKVIDEAIIKEVVTDLDVRRLGSRLEVATSSGRERGRSSHPADGDNQFGSPLGPQSPISFARLLRKIDGPDTSERAAKADEEEPEASLSPLLTYPAPTKTSLAESAAPSSEPVQILGGKRLNPTVLNAMQPPLVSDGMPLRRESAVMVPTVEVARRRKRGRSEFYLLLGVVSLLTAAFYHPQAKTETASLVVPAKGMLESPRATYRIPAALPVQTTGKESASTAKN